MNKRYALRAIPNLGVPCNALARLPILWELGVRQKRLKTLMIPSYNGSLFKRRFDSPVSHFDCFGTSPDGNTNNQCKAENP